jgi:hypothetical protein
VRHLPGSLITRRHVEDLLPILRLDDDQRVRLLALPFPVRFEVVAELLGGWGIDSDVLVDRSGGSP